MGERLTEPTECTEELRGEEAENENGDDVMGKTGCPRITLMGANGGGRGSSSFEFLGSGFIRADLRDLRSDCF